MWKHGKDGIVCSHKFTLFWSKKTSVIVKNISVKLPCIYVCLSSWYPFIFSVWVPSLFSFFCVICTLIFSFPCSLMTDSLEQQIEWWNFQVRLDKPEGRLIIRLPFKPDAIQCLQQWCGEQNCGVCSNTSTYLHADDMEIASDNIMELQGALNQLVNCADSNNLLLTELTVFGKGGWPRKDELIICKFHVLKPKGSFKYLATMLQVPLNTFICLTDKVEAALRSITIKKC